MNILYAAQTNSRAIRRAMQRDMARIASPLALGTDHSSTRANARPKARAYANPLAGLHVVQRCAPADPAAVLDSKLAVRAAFERLRSAPGHGPQAASDFASLACMANVALVRAEAISALLVPPVQAAQDALMRMQARADAGKGYGFDGIGLQAVSEVIEVFEQIMDLSTPAQMHAAAQQTLARMRAGVVLGSAE